jgi:tape measure domain-containing protein
MTTTIDALTFMFYADTSRVEDATKRVADKLDAVGKRVAKIGAGMTAFFGGIATMAVRSAGSFEQTNIAFETMLGSAEGARDLLADLTEFAALTPFEMPEIEAAARGLVQFGERGDELMETLNFLGNASSATSSNFGELALIFNQVRGVGKLLTQDFRQLSTRGVISLQDIADHFGVTLDAAQEMMSKGNVSFEDLRSILKGLSGEGGRFENLMERQSKSLMGLISTIKDAIGITAREIGEQFLPMAKSMAETVLGVIETVRGLSPQMKSFIASIIGLGAAIGGFLTVGGTFIIFLGQITTVLPVLAAKMGFATVQALALRAALVGVGVGAAIFIAYKAYSAYMEDFNKQLAETAKKHKELMGVREDALKSRRDVNKEDPTTGAQKMSAAEETDILKEERIKAETEFAIMREQVTDLEMYMITESAKVNKYFGGMFNPPGKKMLAKMQAELDMAVDRMKAQEKHVKGLNDRLQELSETGEEAPGATPEALENANKYIESLKEQAAVAGMTKEQIEIYRMEQGKVPPELIREAEALQATIKAQEEAMNKKQQATDFYKEMVASIKEETATLGMSREELEIYEAKQAGLSEEQIRAIQLLQKSRKAREEENKLLEESKDIIDSLKTKQQRFNEEQDKLNSMLAKGMLTEDQHAQALKNLAKEYTELIDTASAYIDVLSSVSEFHTSMEGVTFGFDPSEQDVVDSMRNPEALVTPEFASVENLATSDEEKFTEEQINLLAELVELSSKQVLLAERNSSTQKPLELGSLDNGGLV